MGTTRGVIVLCTFLLNLLSTLSQPRLSLNKCCPRGEMYNETFACVPRLGGLSPGRDLSWFPLDTIVNGTTLMTHPGDTSRYQALLTTRYRTRLGEPTCSEKGELANAYYMAEKVRGFGFLLFDNGTMFVHAAPHASYHEETAEFEMFSGNSTKEINMYKKVIQKRVRYYPLEHVCVDELPSPIPDTQVFVLKFCPCDRLTCVRKCCAKNQFWNETAGGCQEIEEVEDGQPSLQGWRPAEKMSNLMDNYYLMSDTFPSCEQPFLLKASEDHYKFCSRFRRKEDNEFFIHVNGSVKVRKYNRPYESHKYCGELTWLADSGDFEENLILCGESQNSNSKLQPYKFMVYGSILIVGAICLLVTVAVSLYLPELRRRMHNKIALSHNASLMVAYFAWGILQLSPDSSNITCIVVTLIIQFTFLGSFFWLNVMCIDISTTFSATRHLGSSGQGESRKFLYYFCYSWGCTVLISIITIIMEFAPDLPQDVYRPGFSCSCGFNTTNASILIYFYGPMLLLLAFNLILFIFTTFKIMTIQRQTAILHKTDSNTTGGSSFQTDKQRLILYSKLFLLMGLTWVTEIISWAVGGPDYFWYFTDILNLLRAVFIFVLFICKKPVLRSLKRRLMGETFSHKTASTKSNTDVISMSNSGRDRTRSSTSSGGKRKESRGEKKETLEGLEESKI